MKSGRIGDPSYGEFALTGRLKRRSTVNQTWYDRPADDPQEKHQGRSASAFARATRRVQIRVQSIFVTGITCREGTAHRRVTQQSKDGGRCLSTRGAFAAVVHYLCAVVAV